MVDAVRMRTDTLYKVLAVLMVGMAATLYPNTKAGATATTVATSRRAR